MTIKIYGSNQASSSLVELRLPILWTSKQSSTPVLFITISPNPNVKVETISRTPNKVRTVKKPYKLIPVHEQYEYCLKIFRDAYLEWLNDPIEMVGTWELNKSGMLHLHILMYSSEIKTDYDIKILRNHVTRHPSVLLNMKKGGKDYMNNIVYVNKDIKEILEYMDKDHSQKLKYFNKMPNFYITFE